MGFREVKYLLWPQYLGSEQPGSGTKASAPRQGPWGDGSGHYCPWRGVWLTVGARGESVRRSSPVPSPPLQTGYMFGKGIYFADMVSKSANYCHTFQGDPVGLILLGEVALGNM